MKAALAAMLLLAAACSLGAVPLPTATADIGASHVSLARGSYCWSSGGQGTCADSAGPDILLKTGEAQTRIICDFYPPEKFKAVYTINAGTALVGVLPETRVPIAKIGDNVVIEGRCKGLSNGGVKLTDCELKVSQ